MVSSAQDRPQGQEPGLAYLWVFPGLSKKPLTNKGFPGRAASQRRSQVHIPQGTVLMEPLQMQRPLPFPNAKTTTIPLALNSPGAHWLCFCIPVFQKSKPKQRKLTQLKIPHWGGRPAPPHPSLTNRLKPSGSVATLGLWVYPNEFPWQTVAHSRCLVLIFMTHFLAF